MRFTKFGWKIFILCIGIYIISLTVTGLVVTENSYRSLLNKEIERSLEEESNLHSTLTLYLLNNKRLSKEKIELEKYSQNVVDIFKTENNYLELFDEKMNLLASNADKTWFLPREELKVALEGNKNFILRKEANSHFLFVANVLEIDKEKMLITLIKDISHVDKQRTEQYLFFMKIGILGLIFVGLITFVVSKYVIEPISQLSRAAQSIASGEYQERAKVMTKDEIGLLAKQFNIMASEIEQKISELEKESQRQQRFIDNLTHELRTPLTSIIGYAELLQTIGYDKKIYDKSLNYIYTEGQRMLNLANNLMDVILLREKAFKLEDESLKALLEEIRDIMLVKAEKKNITLEIVGTDFYLPMDRDLFKGAVINLVDNAIKASKKGSKIILGLEKIENTKIIYVKDFGKGMNSESLNKIIEPFYRVDKARARENGGLGLGLSICHQIISDHGARLEISSELGKGTKVSIVF